ncbi:MAG: hypothetical protein JO056_07520 [Alphaproteobacteria bacterium]|nr:hypothetical protein [Alphaproteobacteria bacterium]
MRAAIALLLLAIGLLAAAERTAATPADGWTVAIEQDGNTIPFAGDVHLKRKPFTFVFTGPSAMGYVVVASREQADLATRTSSSHIAKIVSPYGIYAQANGSQTLIVNGPGQIAAGTNGAHDWYKEDDVEVDSFQSFTIAPDGTATARRDVSKIMIGADKSEQRKTSDIAAYDGGPIYVIVTGNPPVGHMSHLTPRFAALIFD